MKAMRGDVPLVRVTTRWESVNYLTKAETEKLRLKIAEKPQVSLLLV